MFTMPYDQDLAARIRRMLRRRANISARQMFGGVAFMCTGQMWCGTVGRDLGPHSQEGHGVGAEAFSRAPDGFHRQAATRATPRMSFRRGRSSSTLGKSECPPVFERG